MNHTGFVGFLNSFLNPFLQCCAGSIWLMTTDSKIISSSIKFTMQMFTKLVLPIQMEARDVVVISKMTDNESDCECASIFSQIELLKFKTYIIIFFITNLLYSHGKLSNMFCIDANIQ